MRSLHRTAVLGAVLLLAVAPAAAETVTLEPVHDATLIEDPDGARANGAGWFFFIGRTSQQQNSLRRALLRFDVAGAVPRQAIIEQVSLTLFMSTANVAPHEARLHRVMGDWNEGPSFAAGGGGAPSQTGDVTWLHTFYDVEFWQHAGGWFIGRTSARLEIVDDGFYTFDSNPHLVQDVRLWKMAPQRNFGWILIGDETTRQSAKSFVSREFPAATLRPQLEITYRMPGERPSRARIAR